MPRTGLLPCRSSGFVGETDMQTQNIMFDNEVGYPEPHRTSDEGALISSGCAARDQRRFHSDGV